MGREQTSFAPVEPVVDSITAPMMVDFRTIPLAEKKALMEDYNRIVLGHDPKIQTSSIRYGDSFKQRWFASSEGAYIEEEEPNTYAMIVAVARAGDIVQTAFETAGGCEGYQTVAGLQAKAEATARSAVELLAAPVVAGGKYTVIADPLLTGVFTHEAFGHLSEADFVYESERMQALMQLGKRFGVAGLNIMDDGSLAGGLGTHRYDHEGTPTRENYLIRDGILVGRLHSRETAAKMGEQPTGQRPRRPLPPPADRADDQHLHRGRAATASRRCSETSSSACTPWTPSAGRPRWRCSPSAPATAT